MHLYSVHLLKATVESSSGVSPLTKARGKLDLLCAEMAELQSQMRVAGPQAREQVRERYYQESGRFESF